MESMPRVSRRLEALDTSLRRLRRAVWLLSCLVIGLAVGAVGRPAEFPAEASSAGVAAGERAFLSAIEDPFYGQFLQEFEPLRSDPERRRYLTAQVLAAAAVHHVDPDLLLALVAAESGFNSHAVSHKGARGLGQLQFRTAHAVAPLAVRRPEDLHDVSRNLYATARHLRQLLNERAGDLRAALRAYYAGAWDRNRGRRDRDTYVSRVSTYYASLKAQRAHRRVTGDAPAEPAVAERGSGEGAELGPGRGANGGRG